MRRKLFICVLLFFCLMGRRAGAYSAQSAILMEAKTGTILYEQDAGVFLPMASTTKIMTALITLEQPDLDLYFTVDPSAILVEGSSMGLQKGDKVTLRILAAGMLLASGNDAANAAAVRIAGSIEDFALLMNEKAAALGMEDSCFVTPSGLDDELHGSTARDMAVLAAAALQNEDFKAICSQTSMKLSYGNPVYDRWLSNHNRLLKSYEGCVGVKTGFTKKSGRCLVSAAEREGVTLICVTLNAPDDWNDHTALLDYGFSQVSQTDLSPDLSGLRFAVVGGEKETVFAAAESCPATLLSGMEGRIESRLSTSPFFYAPVEEGSLLGTVTFFIDGEDGKETVLAVSEIRAAETVKRVVPSERPSFLIRLKRFLRRLLYA